METVELRGDSESHTLGNLTPDSEYIVTVIALYNGEAEGPAATARFKIGTQIHMWTHQHFKIGTQTHMRTHQHLMVHWSGG